MKKIIIIGAGILGVTTAYKLAKYGIQVTIVDRNDDAQATRAAAGIICPWLAQRRNKAWYQLAKGGANIYPDLISELISDGETNTGYKRVGALGLHTDVDKLLQTEKRVLDRKIDAPEIGIVSLLDKQETNDLFPLLDNNYQSIHVSGAARVDGRALRQSLLNAAIKHGATIINGNAQLSYYGNNITGVKINGEILEADKVIAVSGAWMNELLKPLGVDFGVYPQKAQIIHLSMPGLKTNHFPVIMPPNNQYMLTLNDHRIVIGATHETKAGFDNRVTASGVHEVLAKALEVAPGLADSTILETRVGFRPFTPGSLPVIGPLPGFNGLLLANGLGASGLTIGPYLGTELAKLALGMDLEIDLDNYDVASAIK
jgi:D-amino-acid dehydrogenase